ncbi:F-box domain [Arabidopsis suecica]|uniref:F-box domain n=1 Tax=Arabidopsis suecica TaxID=45249 RepID=A0A8T2AKJ3_ARASU|nr:F-box domain [Arabidopsis suecica]
MAQQTRRLWNLETDWSEMCSDAMKLILESLNFPDFHRARTVCSSWYSVSKSCVAGSRSRYSWLILFPNFSGSCTLFDPVENKTYKTRNPGKSRCLASYGNWLLMLTPRIDFFVLNVFTCERISLPSLSLQGGKVRFRRKDDGRVLFLEHSPKYRETIINRYIETAVLWIDEKTKDFVVCWNYNSQYLFSYKKGDDSWWHLEDTKCLAMAYKNKKLCVYTWSQYIKILDFSDDFPKEIVEENPYLNHRFYYTPEHSTESWRERVAITSSGDVLIIVSIRKTLIENQEKPYFFKIFKMNVEGTEWERVDSLGDEMLVFGDGFIKGNLIYFVSDDSWDPLSDQPFQSSTGVYDLSTTKKRWSRFAYCLSNIRWFVPGSDNKLFNLGFLSTF